MAEPSVTAMQMQGGGTPSALHINAVLTGQPGRVTVGVRDKSGPDGSSRLVPMSLDIALCAAPVTAQVGTSHAPAFSRRSSQLYT